MSTKNEYREILEEEMRRWPDVFWEMGGAGTRHEKIDFFFGLNRRFIHISRGAKGKSGGNGPMNFRSDVRKLLREMGAEPVKDTA